MIVSIALMLSSCGNGKTTDNKLEFPKTTWGMMIDEVKEALALNEDSISNEMIGEKGSMIEIENYESELLKTSKIVLNFIDTGDGVQRLCTANVYYSEETTSEQVVEALKKEYGDPISSITEYQLSGSTLQPDTLKSYEYKESNHVKVWGSSSIADIIDKKKESEYEAAWEEKQVGLTEENWADFAKNTRLSTIIFSDGEGSDSPEKGIYLNGYHRVVYDGIKSQVEK